MGKTFLKQNNHLKRQLKINQLEKVKNSMNEKEINIKIVEDYIIIKKENGEKTVLDETDLKGMIIQHFQLRDELDTINVELNQLGKLVSCV